MTTDGRRVRQLGEIFALAARGERSRAVALSREHLWSFPGDQPLFAVVLDNADESATEE